MPKAKKTSMYLFFIATYLSACTLKGNRIKQENKDKNFHH